MKLINLIATRNILSEHAGEKAPALTSYKIMKLLKASDTEDAFYNEQLRRKTGCQSKRRPSPKGIC